MEKMKVMGERYIACGRSEGELVLEGTPGNALGAYLNGARVTVYGNAQDATADTMNDGEIVIHGGSGDALGYAMRGGIVYVRDSVGYRAGIHMKEYKDKIPVLVIGGSCGSFLGEYQAGGRIIVLGIGSEGVPVGPFCGVGMHGGKIFLRSEELPDDLPAQVVVRKAEKEDISEIEPYIKGYCDKFGANSKDLMSKNFYVLIPNTKNPYKQLYVNA